MWCDKRGNKQIQQQGSTYIALYALIIMWILFFLSFVSFRVSSLRVLFRRRKYRYRFIIVSLRYRPHPLETRGSLFATLAPISAQK